MPADGAPASAHNVCFTMHGIGVSGGAAGRATAAGAPRDLSEGTYDRKYAATEQFDLLEAYEERAVEPARRAGASS